MAGSSAVDKAMDAFRAAARTFWSSLKKVVALGRGRSAGLEEQLARLEDEQAVRDAHIAYVNAYDSGDIDGILALFAEDALLINSRGSFVGKQLIRQKRGLGEWILSDCAPARITTIESRLAREDWKIEDRGHGCGCSSMKSHTLEPYTKTSSLGRGLVVGWMSKCANA